MRLRIDRIVVAERRRRDHGDVAALARSLRTWGLLHPVVVDGAGVLVAGGRRLEAARMLGWADIEATVLERTLTPDERWDAELAENGDRKDLTAYERSLDRVRRAEEAERELTARIHARGGHESGRARGGQPKGAVREQEIADAIGEKRQTLQRARDHVAAVEKYPDLEPLEEGQAVRIASALDATPEEEKQAKLEIVREMVATPPVGAAHREQIAAIEATPGVQAAAFRKRASTALRETRKHLLALEAEEVAAILPPADVVLWRDLADQCRGWFDRLEHGLRRGIHAVGG